MGCESRRYSSITIVFFTELIFVDRVMTLPHYIWAILDGSLCDKPEMKSLDEGLEGAKATVLQSFSFSFSQKVVFQARLRWLGSAESSAVV